MAKFNDISGLKFNRLTVVSRAESLFSGIKPITRWNCLCDCGNEVIVHGSKIRSGHTKSCGCQKEITDKIKRDHRTGTPEYDVWSQMIQRCKNSNCASFPEYGGRGIKVCTRWMDFENFIHDMGRRPASGVRMTIERVDVNGDYEPKNCIWASYKQQNRNYRRNYVIEFNGAKKILQDWAIDLGMTGCSLKKRIKKWGIQQALTLPKGAKRV